jgi:hypothetical protein
MQVDYESPIVNYQLLIINYKLKLSLEASDVYNYRQVFWLVSLYSPSQLFDNQ